MTNVFNQNDYTRPRNTQPLVRHDCDMVILLFPSTCQKFDDYGRYSNESASSTKHASYFPYLSKVSPSSTKNIPLSLFILTLALPLQNMPPTFLTYSNESPSSTKHTSNFHIYSNESHSFTKHASHFPYLFQ